MANLHTTSRFRYALRVLLICLPLLPSAAWAGRSDTLRFEAAPILPDDGNTIHYAYVYLPDEYDSLLRQADNSSTPPHRYPVVYLFHGFMGNQYSWEDKGQISQILDSLIAGAYIEPVIAVMPYCIPNDTTQAVKLRTFTYNTFHYGRLRHGEFEKTFSDIEAYIKAHYMVADDSLCVLAGLSYGARVAANIAKNRNYRSVGLFSPVISRQQYPDSCQFKNENHTRYWIACGRADFFRPDTKRLIHYMDQHNLPYDYYNTNGRHSWKTWRRYIVQFLIENYHPTVSVCSSGGARCTTPVHYARQEYSPLDPLLPDNSERNR